MPSDAAMRASARLIERQIRMAVVSATASPAPLTTANVIFVLRIDNIEESLRRIASAQMEPFTRLAASLTPSELRIAG